MAYPDVVLAFARFRLALNLFGRNFIHKLYPVISIVILCHYPQGITMLPGKVFPVNPIGQKDLIGKDILYGAPHHLFIGALRPSNGNVGYKRLRCYKIEAIKKTKICKNFVSMSRQELCADEIG